MFKNILIVCTGNICRSPMAEGLLRTRLHALGLKVKVASAGVAAMAGWPADPLAIEVMHDHGIDIRSHVAQQVTAPLLSASDLILTLDRTHSDWMNRQYPQFRGRVHKILKWHKNRDVADPYGHPKTAFRHAYKDIDLGLTDWLKHLN